MKSLVIVSSVVIVCGALALGGCKKQEAAVPPTANAVTSVEQQNREIAERLQAQKAEIAEGAAKDAAKAERERVVSALRDVATRWNNEFAKINGKLREDLPPILAALRGIRADVNFVPTSACTRPLQSELGAAMDGALAAVEEFRSGNGNPPEELVTRINELGGNSVLGVAGRVSACLSRD
jgi:hypothetical protein